MGFSVILFILLSFGIPWYLLIHRFRLFAPQRRLYPIDRIERIQWLVFTDLRHTKLPSWAGFYPLV
jgi:hypothetical protein